MGQTAIVFGATGLVGGELVNELLVNKDYDKVIAVTRRKIPIGGPKLEQLKLHDFKQLGQLKNKLDASAYFCCIGTTIKKTGSKEAFRKVDYDIPFMIAKMAEALKVPSLVVISSIGATTKTANFYLRTKGEMELAVHETYSGNLSFIRPSLLIGHRSEYRFGESLAIFFMKLFGWLFVGPLKKYRGIKAKDVARAMVLISRQKKPKKVYGTLELRQLIKG
ncbi:MAG: NAD-dependent epimerase/dehydratase family protein [Bacteroidota bacterium]|nr:NAD-dependent epimerase/dehydratase family protein [Bacteroidota bacterium]